MISAISLDGVFAEAEFRGSMDSVRFRHYSNDLLIPELRPGMTVIMDNLSSHKDVEDLFNKNGINVLYLPPYTPEYNPIEMMWEYIKNYLRKNRAKNIEQLKQNITCLTSTKAFFLKNYLVIFFNNYIVHISFFIKNNF